MIHHKREQGFTLIESMIVLVITGILSSIAITSYREQTKKAYATEIKTQLSAASRKLIPTIAGVNFISEETCLEVASLGNSNNFSYSCKMREDGSDIFISM